MNDRSEVINASEFHFQKGTDALVQWLQMNLNDEQQNKLIGLINHYNDFALINKDHEFYKIKELLFTIVSYCDLHARDKKKYNEYSDFRVLAKAGVRMKPWIIHIMNYKFEKHRTNITIKNALDMLIDPENNINSIATSHRKLISQYYLKKNYDSSTFVKELKLHFKYLDQTKNPKNQTVLITKELYSQKQNWEKKVITFPQFNESFIDYVCDNQLSYHVGKSTATWFWVFDTDGNFNDTNAHYEFIMDNGIIEVDLHFEISESAELMRNAVGVLPDNLRWKPWISGKSISHKTTFKLTDEDLLEKAIDLLNELYEATAPLIKNLLIKPDSEKNHFMKSPLNQILFGPPGTGKTYKLQQIIENWGLREETEIEKDYSTFVKDFTWWKIIALVLHERGQIIVPELAKHPLIIAKLGSSNFKSLNTRLWTSLQNHTVDECKNVKFAKRIGEKIFYKEVNSLWRLNDSKSFENEYSYLIESYIEFKKEGKNKISNYSFTTCHQSLSYEDFIEGIKPILNNDKSEDEEVEKNISYEIRKGIFYIACEKAVQLAGFINLKDCFDRPKEKRKELFSQAISEKKIHVIFMDEINRCNVSNVFGELITLIEDDKRMGNEHEICDVILPYSQDKFGVPPNLYIIGTMNTADRSVEALDTALRRRFSFEEIIPNSQLIASAGKLKASHGVLGEINLPILLDTINLRIEALSNRDYKIGHSFFMKVENEDDLKNTFKRNIIPLLQEYFYSDYEKIGMIIGQGFFEIPTTTNKSAFALFSTENNPESIKIHKLKNIDTEFNIVSAISQLMPAR